MEAKHLAPHVARLGAANAALASAIKAEDWRLIQEAHEAVGRARQRLAPTLALYVKDQQRQEQTAADRKVSASARGAVESALGDAHEPTAAERTATPAAQRQRPDVVA